MTFTWGITAPLASFTVPVIWPVAVCAFDVPAVPSRKTSAAPSNATRLLGLMSSSPSRECSSRLAVQTTHPSQSDSVTLHRAERVQKLHILALLLPTAAWEGAILVWSISSVKSCSAVSAVLLKRTCQ